MKYIKPTIRIVFLEDIMETFSASNVKEGDASTDGRAKETLYIEEESGKTETGIPAQFQSIWDEDEE